MNRLNKILDLSGVNEAKVLDLSTLEEMSNLSKSNDKFVTNVIQNIIPNLEKEQKEIVNFLFFSKDDNIILMNKNAYRIAIAVCSSLDNLGLLKLSMKKIIS